MTRRTSKELFQLYAAHKAAAAALEAELKGRALDAHEAGELASGPLPGVGRVTLAFAHDAAAVVDEQAFLRFLQQRLPDEVVTVLAPRNPNWVKVYLESLIPDDPDETPPGKPTTMHTPDGASVPGVVWTKGGKLTSVSLAVERDVQRRLGVAAKQYATGAGKMPGLTSGETDARTD